MGMARSAVRSRSLSLRHTKISLTLTKSVMLDLTVICMGDRLLTQENPNPRLTPPPELRSGEHCRLGSTFRQYPPSAANFYDDEHFGAQDGGDFGGDYDRGYADEELAGAVHMPTTSASTE